MVKIQKAHSTKTVMLFFRTEHRSLYKIMSEKNKLSIICMSGDFDKAIAIFTLASGAAAVNYEVNLFFTFWGLNTIKKKKTEVLSAKECWHGSSISYWEVETIFP